MPRKTRPTPSPAPAVSQEPATASQRTVNRRRFLFAPMLLAYAIVVGFALTSYDWRDISWLSNPPNVPYSNAMGYLGAWMTFMGYQFAGLAYRWFALPLIGVLFCFLCHGRVVYFRLRLVWMFLFYVTAACICQLCGADSELLDTLNLHPNAGGALGQWLTTMCLQPFLGDVGTHFLLWPLLVFLGLLTVGIRNTIFFMVRLVTTRPHQSDDSASRPLVDDVLRPRDIRLTPPAEAPAKKPSLLGALFAKREKEEMEDEDEEQDMITLLTGRQGNTPPPPARSPRPVRTPLPTTPLSSEEERYIPPRPTQPAPEPFALSADNPATLRPMKDERAITAPLPAAHDSTEPPPPQEEVEQMPDYGLPTPDLLDPIPKSVKGSNNVSDSIAAIEGVFREFNLDATVVHYTSGPVVTQFEIKPAPNIRIQAFKGYEQNLLLALKAESIRIQTPLPGRDVVGIEVPNAVRQSVTLRELLESDSWKKAERSMALPLALGKTSTGENLIVDLAEMPHLLVAGGTGSGKSVAVNDMLMGLLMSRKPEQLRLMMVDPKRVEFTFYDDLPHLLIPVVVDPKKVIFGLRWAVMEMGKRYNLLQKYKVRNIADYNYRVKHPARNVPNPETPLPYIVIVIDELADLMLSVKADIEPHITSLTQKARAAGIHLIIATQRPTTDIITGTIKANIPGRLALRVAQGNDSRTILGETGAERLIGKGDMLLARGGKPTVRSQAAWITDNEIIRVCDFIKEQADPFFDTTLNDNMGRIREEAESNTIEKALEGLVDEPAPQAQSAGGGPLGDEDDKSDEGYYRKALELIRQTGRFSTSAMQRRLGIGYNKAGRITDMLEARGIIGPQRGNAPREILVDLNAIGRAELAGTDGEDALMDTRTNPMDNEPSDTFEAEPSMDDVGFDMDLDANALDDDMGDFASSEEDSDQF